MTDAFAERRVDRGGQAVPGDRAALPVLDESLRAAADRVLAAYPEPRRDQVLPILQALQEQAGYLPQELVAYTGRRLGIPFAELYSIVTFYGLLSTHPVGETVLRPCKGIACYLRGAAALGEH